MKYGLTFLAAAALIASAACSQKTVKDTYFDGFFDGDIVPGAIELQVADLGVDTTVVVRDGMFQISLPVDTKALGSITVADDLPVRSIPFIPDGSEYTITLDSLDGRVRMRLKSENPEAFSIKLQEVCDRIALFAKENKAFEKAVMDTTKLSMGLADHILMAKSAEIDSEKADFLLGVLAANKDNALGKFAFGEAVNHLDNARIDSVLASVDTSMVDMDKARAVKARNTALEATSEGKPFVSFDVTLEDGTVTRLSEYVGRGKYTIVDFWASWCPWCIAEIPYLKAVYRKYAGHGLDIVGVDVADSMDKAKAAIAEHGIDWPQVYSKDRVNGTYYGSRGIPLIILFGPDGTILKRDLRCEDIEEAVATYISL